MSVKGRILGIDPGEKRIGLAVSDPLGITAQGLETIQVSSSGETLRRISETAWRLEVVRIVVGLPLRMDGSEGEGTRRARRLGGQLESALGLPVIFRDERLTSRLAEQALLEGNLSRERRREESDRLAAQLILQNYLDSGEGGR
jgi:putative Holliday junction resolvase